MKPEIKERIDKINRGQVPEGYKKSKFGIIPEDWDIKKLKEVTDYVDYRGKTPRKVAEGVFLVTAKNIKEGYIDYNISKEYVSEEEYDLIMKRGKPKIGDVLFTTEAPLGNVAQVDRENIALAQRVIKFRGKNNLSNDYLKYYLLGEIFQSLLKNKAIGSTVLGIQGKQLHNLEICVPLIEEQQKIADILSTWDKAIELKEKLIEQKKELKKGLMQKLLTGEVRVPGFNGEWKEYRLGTLSEISTGNKDTKDKVENGSYPFFVRSEKIERINSYSYDGEAILIPGDGNVGKIYHYINGKFDFHQRVYKISDFNNKCIGKFIYYYLQQYFYREAMKYSAKATVDSLRLPMLTDMIIRLPEIPEQIAIVKILDAADKEISFLNQELEKLNLQKKGLMQLLLTGKVRVKV